MSAQKKNAHKTSAITAVVVNDNAIQLSILQALLHKQGIEAQAFYSAEKALLVMDAENPPDIIVTDLHMPGIDGWRFCRLLRSPEYKAFNTIPILVVSATFAGEEVFRITADLGANAFMSAPIDGQRFAEVVQALLNGERPKEYLRVLIVEDSKTQAALIEQAFTDIGFEAETAFTAQAGVAAFSKTIYDVAVIDYHLPDGSGSELLTLFLKEHPDCTCIMMTADSNPELALDWMKKGAAAYLHKPFEPAYLIELCAHARREHALLRVEHLLEKRTCELRDSLLKHERLVDNLTGTILYRHDTEGIFDYVSSSITQVLGYTEEEFLKHFSEYMTDHPANQAAHEHTALSIRGIQQQPYEAEFHAKDGGLHWLEVMEVPVRNARGQVVAVEGVAHDITTRKRAEQRLEKVNQCLLGLGADVDENIQQLTALCGEIFKPACALYNRLENDLLCSWGQWQTPPDYNPKDKPEGHICYDVIRNADKDVFVVRDLQKSHYAKTDPNVVPYALETYIGHMVKCKGEAVGSLCIVFQQDLDPTPNDKKILGIIASAVGAMEERREAETRTSRDQQQLELVVQGSNIGWWDWDIASGREVYNEILPKLLGYEINEIEPHITWWENKIHPDDLTLVGTDLQEHFDGKTDFYINKHRLKTKAGDWKWFLDHGKVVERDADGKPVRMSGTLRNIDEQEQAEEERANHLRFLENVARIDQAIQQATDLEQMMSDVLQTTLDIFECDRACLLYPCDPETESWRVPMMRTRPEYRNDVVINTDIPLHPDDRSIFSAVLNADHPVGFGANNEEPLPEDIAQTFAIQTQLLTSLHPRTGKPWAFGLHQCSRERVWTNEERNLFKEIGHRLGDALSTLLFLRDLRKSEQSYRLLADNTADIIWLADLDIVFTYLSPAIQTVLGFTPEELVGTKLDKLLDQDTYARIGKLVEEQIKLGPEAPPILFEAEMFHHDGHLIPVEVKGRVLFNEQGEPVALQGTSRDITERRKLEEQLRQSQKMEAIGQLTGGIAHDFNNLLQVINSGSDMALMDLDSEHPAYDTIKYVIKAGDRAATLVKQLLAFSRRQVLDMKDANLNDVVASLMSMIRHVIGEHIKLSILPCHNLGIVRADPGQIEQILMNLCINAAYAMPEGGTITIETENVQIDEEYCQTHPWAEEGRYVLLSVTDSGCGIDAKTLTSIFEPFFTTKDVGEGSGLGLSTVFGLVKQHKGMVDVYSEIDKGTTFKIYIPMVGYLASSTEVKIEGPAPGGTETILLAEDDKMVLDLGKAMLEHAGYTVLTATNGEEALHIFNLHAETINLALLDVMMPKLSGRAVFERISEGRPNLRFLFASGYSMNAIHTNFVLDKNLALIQKPYRRHELLRKVREVLDA